MWNPFHSSSKWEKDLQSEHAQTFREVCWDHAVVVFEQLCAHEQYAPWAAHFRLDPLLAMTAFDSAYNELVRDKDFHGYKNGPSGEKRAAAVAAWVAILRPIHFLEDMEPDKSLMFVNAFFGLWTALSIKAALEAAKEQTSTEAEAQEIVDRLDESWDDAVHELLYAMVWRNPDYRQLALVFRLAPFV